MQAAFADTSAAPAYAPAALLVYGIAARALEPRKALSVSECADQHRILSSKGSAEPGRWRTDRNPLQREPMDCFSKGSRVRDVVMLWPIQMGKTEVCNNIVLYTWVHDPGPIMVCQPNESAQLKYHQQKLRPMIEESPAMQAAAASLASREASNTIASKDFAGGIFMLEHAGSPARLAMASVRTLISDETDKFAVSFPASGGDPLKMLEGRTSAFPFTYKRLYIGTPELKGTSRLDWLWERSDQRRYNVACPHCGEMQPLFWAALHWANDVRPGQPRAVWMECRGCGERIEEHHKTQMIRWGRWVPENPDARIRGYHTNCLYYPVGLGPSWADLVEEWLDAQGDPARLKVFITERLAEAWQDASTRNVKANVVEERAESYALRTAPRGVLAITAGVDTQDDRLELHIIGWGHGFRSFWALDYAVLPGDPDGDDVWAALTDVLNRPIQHESGALLSVEATSIDMFGHRTEAVKSYVRARRIRRAMAAFGATANTAPILGKAKLQDVTYRGKTDRKGVHIYQLGTVAAKHVLYARLAADADAHDAWLRLPDTEERPPAPDRNCHFSDQLPADYFKGLISEVFNPAKNRFEKRRGGVRNEPLDTWVHAFAAAHHPELRLHRLTRADWDRREKQLLGRAPEIEAAPAQEPAPGAPAQVHTHAPVKPKGPSIGGKLSLNSSARFGGGAAR